MNARLLQLAVRAALVLFLAAVLGALAVLVVVPRAVHGATLTVLTGSMTPTIPVGSVVVVRPVDPGTLHVGDVMTFQRSAGKKDFITHRITEVHADTRPVTFTTKGDANRGDDVAPVPATAVRGKVLFHVPVLGTLRNALSVGSLAGPLGVVALLGYAGTQLLAARRDKRAVVPLPTLAPGGQLSVQLLVAVLPIAEFEGLSPRTVADLLRMELLDESHETFTVALAREPADLDLLVDALLPFRPLHLERSELLSVPGCADTAPPALELVPDVAA